MTAVAQRPVVRVPARGFAAANPVAKLGASALLAVALVLSLDWVSASVALALESVLLAACGVPWRTLWIRTLPIWAAAPFAGLTVLLYGRPEGRVYVSWLLVQISDGSVELAIATVLRVLAIGLPSVALFLTVDPTDLADGLAQRLRLPSRFVLGALGGLRLVTLFQEDWRALELARRARGVADTGRVRRFAGQAFALLVLAIRRGSTLATAMEARAFGAPVRRTWARASRFGAVDAVLLASSGLIGAVAVAASVAAGEWNFVGGG
ncbi:MAG: transporter [Microbacteriaceae bacterium]|jgi:energy-coupling factor transport system permease protein|uniref:energy-coupling factor transporter transmembrane component T family protein n=1 Tax=Naasia sp. TaxID=2546198 RepID=UPI00260301CB|nr:energy-coupling factor transporter transmembrane component T [Naasia sp.]MCU1569696.1 transporter [Naasia sp.]MCU1638671.1 transporter [Microbacteriaceae bacterium]